MVVVDVCRFPFAGHPVQGLLRKRRLGMTVEALVADCLSNWGKGVDCGS